MAKLQKREIIILGVMGVAVLFGAFNFLMPARKPAPGSNAAQKTEDLSAFLGKIQGKTASVVVDTQSNVIFAKAKSDWTPDPFLDKASYDQWVRAQIAAKAAPVVAKKEVFAFTGYLATGSQRMAIVNGIEYREGAKLEPRGYVLQGVTPTKITIVNKATGAKETVLLQDDGGVNESQK